MNIFLYILIVFAIFGLLFFLYAIATAEPYPQELEDEEEKRILKLFEEHKKSQK